MGLDTPIRIGVVGTGSIAVGIIECCARRGCDVLVYDTPDALELGRRRIEDAVTLRLRTDRATLSESAATLNHISYTSTLSRLGDRQFLFDTGAITERNRIEALERVARLEALLDDLDATLVVTSSALPISEVAAATAEPWRVLGARFLVPVPALALMELVTGRLTRPKVAFKTAAFVTAVLGKTLIHSDEHAIFNEDAMPIPYILSAIRLSESNLAEADDVDTSTLPGCKQPIGPLEFADLLGLDTLRAIVEVLHHEYPHPHYEVPESVLRNIERGHLGRKTGRGFFRYPAIDTTSYHVVAAPPAPPAPYAEVAPLAHG